MYKPKSPRGPLNESSLDRQSIDTEPQILPLITDQRLLRHQDDKRNEAVQIGKTAVSNVVSIYTNRQHEVAQAYKIAHKMKKVQKSLPTVVHRQLTTIGN